MRSLLAGVLEAAGFDVTTAANAADASRIIRKVDPDGLVVDVELGPGPTGLDLVESFLVQMPHLAIVILTRIPDGRFVGKKTPTLAPNIAWLRKQEISDPQTLIDVLEKTLQEQAMRSDRADLHQGRPFAKLSDAQVEILRLIAEGLTNAEIAQQRGTSVRAVEHLIRRAFAAADIGTQESQNPRVAATRLIAKHAALPGV